jgi:hypothetical protein
MRKIDMPPAISTRPSPISQRRSKPVNGSVVAFSLLGAVLLVGVVVVLGAVSLAGVVFYDSLLGETPELGVVVGLGGSWL